MGSISRRYAVRAHGNGVDTMHTSLSSAYKELRRLEAMGAEGVTIEHLPAQRPLNLWAPAPDEVVS